ncbi:MAG: hypothetical protein ACK479_03400 [Fluviicola sp.]
MIVHLAKFQNSHLVDLMSTKWQTSNLEKLGMKVYDDCPLSKFPKKSFGGFDVD